MTSPATSSLPDSDLHKAPPSRAHAPVASSRRTRWKRRLAWTVGVVVALVLFHSVLFRFAATALIVDEPSTAGAALLLLDADRQFDVAAERASRESSTVILCQFRPGRLERLGILPSSEILAQNELRKRDVSLQQIELLFDQPIARFEVPSRLCHWLREHPDREVDVLCSRFSTRTWNLLVNRAADGDLRSRIHLIALPHRNYDETNWWHSKAGILAVVNGYIRFAFHWWHSDGEPTDRNERTDAEFASAAFSEGNSP